MKPRWTIIVDFSPRLYVEGATMMDEKMMYPIENGYIVFISAYDAGKIGYRNITFQVRKDDDCRYIPEFNYYYSVNCYAKFIHVLKEWRWWKLPGDHIYSLPSIEQYNRIVNQIPFPMGGGMKIGLP